MTNGAAACVAVYAYYAWYITGRLSHSEVASGQTSPAIQARAYKTDAIIRLKDGGQIVIKADGEAPEIKYTLEPIDTTIEKNAAKAISASAAKTK